MQQPNTERGGQPSSDKFAMQSCNALGIKHWNQAVSDDTGQRCIAVSVKEHICSGPPTKHKNSSFRDVFQVRLELFPGAHQHAWLQTIIRAPHALTPCPLNKKLTHTIAPNITGQSMKHAITKNSYTMKHTDICSPHLLQKWTLCYCFLFTPHFRGRNRRKMFEKRWR